MSILNLKTPSISELTYIHGYILSLIHSSEEFESLFHRLCDLEKMFCEATGLESKLVEWKLVDPPEIAEEEE